MSKKLIFKSIQKTAYAPAFVGDTKHKKGIYYTKFETPDLSLLAEVAFRTQANLTNYLL